jgi:hypothetical protein
MNGDGDPDVVSPEWVQYTSPRGVLAERASLSIGGIRETSSGSKTVGIGGQEPVRQPWTVRNRSRQARGW